MPVICPTGQDLFRASVFSRCVKLRSHRHGADGVGTHAIKRVSELVIAQRVIDLEEGVEGRRREWDNRDRLPGAGLILATLHVWR